MAADEPANGVCAGVGGEGGGEDEDDPRQAGDAVAQEDRRALWAQSRRIAAAKAIKQADEADKAKCAAADERRAAKTCITGA